MHDQHDHGHHHAHEHHHHQPQRQRMPAASQLGSPILAMSARRRLAYAAVACTLIWAAVAWALLVVPAGAGS